MYATRSLATAVTAGVRVPLVVVPSQTCRSANPSEMVLGSGMLFSHGARHCSKHQEHMRAGQGRAGQGRVGQGRAGQDRGRAGQQLVMCDLNSTACK